MAAEREILTYEMFGTAVREIAQQVVDSGFEPDLVLSVARGGMGLGMGLGYALDVKNISLRGIGQPEDLVGMFLFLLSDQARWITGQIFNVDGGQIIRS